MSIQVMKPEDVPNLDFDPFDVTKVWPRSQYPLQEVGVLTLNRNPEDYHRDVEQAAFSPGSLVPGIELSPDTLLQWRAFFVSLQLLDYGQGASFTDFLFIRLSQYRDAQYYRLGSANIHQM